MMRMCMPGEPDVVESGHGYFVLDVCDQSGHTVTFTCGYPGLATLSGMHVAGTLSGDCLSICLGSQFRRCMHVGVCGMCLCVTLQPTHRMQAPRAQTLVESILSFSRADSNEYAGTFVPGQG